MIASIEKKELKNLSPTWKLLFNVFFPEEEVYVEKTPLEEQLAKLIPGERKTHFQKFLNERLCFILGMQPVPSLLKTKGSSTLAWTPSWLWN